MKTIKLKKVKMTLVWIDWNSFAILWAFRRNALKQGLDKEKVAEIINEAMSSDYSHLICTINDNITW